ncbi:MAG: tetratricopeptide repeat protein [Rhodothalassiaceae bacterium]
MTLAGLNLAAAAMWLLLGASDLAPLYDRAMAAYEAARWHEALPLLRDLSARGHAGAATRLGIMHYRGEGVPADPSKAALWFFKAARRGQADAQLAFGALNWHGTGVAKDPEQALHWLILAQRSGDAAVRAEAERLAAAVRADLDAAAIGRVLQQVERFQPVPRADP